MRKIVFLLVFVFMGSSVFAWEVTQPVLPDDAVTVLDFLVPETGMFADYPLMLCSGDNWTCLIWLADPAVPYIIGTFPNKIAENSVRVKSRLICDDAGNPIIVELSPGRCNIIIHEPGGWLPKRAVNIAGSQHCVALDPSGDLVVDYITNENLNRTTINLETWMSRTQRVERGGSHYSSGPHSYSSSDYTNYPRAVRIYVRYGEYHFWDGHYYGGAATWEVSIIPESELSNWAGRSYYPGQMVADLVSENNWVAAYADGSIADNNDFFIRSSNSRLQALGHLTQVAVDATANGEHYVVWQDTDGEVKLMAGIDGAWQSLEAIGIKEPEFEALKLAVSNHQIWVLFKDTDGIFHILTEQEYPGTPTPCQPPPTFTPGPEEVFVEIHISSLYFEANERFGCDIWLNNPSENKKPGLPLYMLLDVHGQYFFGPEFSQSPSDYSSLFPTFSPGYSEFQMINDFQWPKNCGSASGICLISAVLNADHTEVVSNIDIVKFAWGD